MTEETEKYGTSAATPQRSLHEASDDARRAGRGGVAVLGAKAFFIVLGLAQQALLPRAIGLAGYGALSRVLAVSNVFNNVIVSSSTQGVSRVIAGAKGKEREALRAVLRVHVPLGIGAAVLLVALSPIIGRFEHAPYIVVPLATMGGVLGVYGIYAPLIGFLNGRAEFTKQAALDVTAATLRTLGLVGLGALFVSRGLAGVLGSALGAVFASVAVLGLALSWTGVGTLGSGPAARVPASGAYLAGLLPVLLAQLFTNGLMQADITLLGRFLSASAVATGAADPTKVADEWVGVYRACQLFAFLPYQLLFSITQVLFPMLARAKAEGDPRAIAKLVANGTRLGAIACGLMVCVVVTMPESLIRFAYSTDIASRGATTLRVLALGQGTFAILGLATIVLVSLGREIVAMAITATALVGVVVACALTVPGATFGDAQLRATALATAIALGLGLVVAALAVRRETGAFVPAWTALRVSMVVGLGASMGRYLPLFGKALTPLVALLVGASYVGLLVLSGELTGADRQLMSALVARRSKR